MKLRRPAFAIGLSIALYNQVLADTDEAFTAYTKTDYATAFKLYYERALNGDATAEGMLGSLYAYGRGVARDDVQEAVYWFRKVAEKGMAEGQVSLGMMYLQGRGVSYNATEAARWIRKAAEQDNFLAEYVLSVLYEQGQGVPKDAAQAAYWKRKSDDFAHNNLKDILPTELK